MILCGSVFEGLTFLFFSVRYQFLRFIVRIQAYHKKYFFSYFFFKKKKYDYISFYFGSM